MFGVDPAVSAAGRHGRARPSATGNVLLAGGMHHSVRPIGLILVGHARSARPRA